MLTQSYKKCFKPLSNLGNLLDTTSSSHITHHYQSLNRTTLRMDSLGHPSTISTTKVHKDPSNRASSDVPWFLRNAYSDFNLNDGVLATRGLDCNESHRLCIWIELSSHLKFPEEESNRSILLQILVLQLLLTLDSRHIRTYADVKVHSSI